MGLIKDIIISFSHDHWIDRTNGKIISGVGGLIKYVNMNELTVLNEDIFLYKEEFWYNKGIKKEPMTANPALSQNI